MNQYDFNKNGEIVDKEALKEEIIDEKMSDEELFSIIKEYFTDHSFKRGMYSCASFGIREHSSGYVEYFKVKLEDLNKCFIYTEEQKLKLYNLQSRPQLIIDGVIIEPWRAISLFEDEISSRVYYHLHPELVKKQSDSKPYSTHLCHRCFKCTDNKPPHNLTAAGVDFGWYH